MRPEQTRLALTLADGSLTIMHFVTKSFRPDGSVHFEAEVSDESVRAECAKAGLDLVRWRHLHKEYLPDREYRNAWVDTGHRIDHDMTKARDIHRDKLRRARVKRLAALDVDYQRADEAGDKKGKQAIAAAKQKLRDAPADPRIDKCSCIAELCKITLD